MNKKNIKWNFKFILLGMLPFLFYGNTIYAENIKIYVDAQNKKVLTEEEYDKIDSNEKGKYKPVIIDENNKTYTININNGCLLYTSPSPRD